MSRYLQLIAEKPRPLAVGRNPLDQSRFNQLFAFPPSVDYLVENAMAAALNAKAASPIWTQKQEFEHFGNVKQAEHEADAILTEWIRERELEVSLMDELLNLAPWAHGNCIINHDQADLEFKLQRPKDIARRESREVRAYMVMQWQAEAVEVEAERERQMNRASVAVGFTLNMVASQPTPDHISGRSMEGANPVIDDQSGELPNRTANVSSGAPNGVENGAESSQIAERKRKRSSEEIKQELLDKVRAKALLLPAPSPVSPTRSASTTPPRSSPPTSVESASPSSPASPQPVVVGEKMCIVGIPVYAREITMLRVFLASVYRGCRSTSEGGRMLWRLKAERKGEMEARLRELETGWIAIEDIPTEEE